MLLRHRFVSCNFVVLRASSHFIQDVAKIPGTVGRSLVFVRARITEWCVSLNDGKF